MSEKTNEEPNEVQAWLLIFSYVMPMIGFIIAVYYWIRRNKNMAVQFVIAGIIGLVIDLIINLIFDGELLSSMNWKTISSILACIIGIVITSNLIDRVRIRWAGSALLVVSILFMLLPAIGLKNWINNVMFVPQLCATLFTYVLFVKATKTKHWLAFIIAILAGAVWALWLVSMAGVLFNI